MLAFQETKFNGTEHRPYTLGVKGSRLSPSILSFSMSINKDEKGICYHVGSCHEFSVCLHHHGPNDIDLKILSVTIIVYRELLGRVIYDSRYQVTLMRTILVCWASVRDSMNVKQVFHLPLPLRKRCNKLSKILVLSCYWQLSKDRAILHTRVYSGLQRS